MVILNYFRLVSNAFLLTWIGIMKEEPETYITKSHETIPHRGTDKSFVIFIRPKAMINKVSGACSSFDLCMAFCNNLDLVPTDNPSDFANPQPFEV